MEVVHFDGAETEEAVERCSSSERDTKIPLVIDDSSQLLWTLNISLNEALKKTWMTWEKLACLSH